MKSWTVEDLVIDKYKYFGVPHFQRGLVWNKDSVSRLLESLFYDTPCGAIVLWEPLIPENEGVLLPHAEKIKYLIIDGQQRIRSIHDAFSDFHSDDINTIDGNGHENGPDLEVDGTKDNVWCLNLTRISEISLMLDRNLQGYPLFMKAKDPRAKGKKRFSFNLLPLKLLLAESDLNSVKEIIKPAPGKSAEDVFAEVKRIDLVGQIKQMYCREFPVAIKEESEGNNTIADLVQIYNRINSGGMRVESEEKAFATLVTTRQDVNGWLQDLFRELHPQKLNSNGDKPDFDRDDILQRKKERNFGFKLFIRTFVQTCGFHFDVSLGSGSLAFDMLSRPLIQKELMNSENGKKIAKLFEYSSSVLKYIHDILIKDLYCDNLQFLPETISLIPTFQLLLKYPTVINCKRYRPMISLLILKSMLLDQTQREVLELAGRIRMTNSFDKCAKIILAKKISKVNLHNRLIYSNSLQNRYVLLLYWLERKHVARDFSYKNLPKGCPSSLKTITKNGEEVTVEASVSPEKQHIVPYSILKGVYNLESRTRISSHKVNNIGNVTYISRALNGFDEGLGSQPIEMEYETDSNLESHFLLKPKEDKGNALTISLYNEIIANNEDNSVIRKKFEKYCKHRIHLIEEGFLSWVYELENTMPKIDREKPTALLFADNKFDKVRELNYAAAVEEELFSIIENGAAKGRAPGFLNILQKRDSKRIQVFQLQLEKEYIDLKISQPQLVLVKNIDKDKGVNCLNKDTQIISLAVRGDGIDETVEVLRAIVLYQKDGIKPSFNIMVSSFTKNDPVERDSTSIKRSNNKVKIDSQTFLNELPGEYMLPFKKWIEIWENNPSLEVFWNTKGFSLKVPTEDGGKLERLMMVYFHWKTITLIRAKDAQKLYLKKSAYQEYLMKIHEIPSAANWVSADKTEFGFDQVTAEDLEKILGATDKLAQTVIENRA